MSQFPPKRVLVAADLSKPSLAALEAAKFLARRWRSGLELVHVDEVPRDAANFGDGMPLMTTAYTWPWKDFHQWREQRLRKAAANFPASRLKIRGIPGWPPTALTDLARQGGAGFVVIGTHGYAGLDRALFGSISEAVMRRARVPVLAVHRRATPFRVARILAPWNAQPYATRALRYARDLAKSLGARVEVLHVAPPSANADELTPKLRRLLEPMFRGARNPRWSLRVRQGDPRQVILEEARPGRFDLLLLSAHRRPFSSDFVLGSTVERMLRHARIDILAVPSVGPRRRGLGEFPKEHLLDDTYIF